MAQPSLIALDKAKIDEDNNQNVLNMRKFGVAQLGEFGKKLQNSQTEFMSASPSAKAN